MQKIAEVNDWLRRNAYVTLDEPTRGMGKMLIAESRNGKYRFRSYWFGDAWIADMSFCVVAMAGKPHVTPRRVFTVEQLESMVEELEVVSG